MSQPSNDLASHHKGDFADSRVLPRTNVKFSATFTDDNGKKATGIIYDVCETGATVECFFSPRVGTKLLITFNITIDGERKRVDAIGRVIHCICSPGGKRFNVGIDFIKVARDGLAIIAQYIQVKNARK